MAKIIEYEIEYTDGDVDHIDWRLAKVLVAHPPDDIVRIERIVRHGTDAESETHRDYETLYDRSK